MRFATKSFVLAALASVLSFVGCGVNSGLETGGGGSDASSDGTARPDSRVVSTLDGKCRIDSDCAPTQMCGFAIDDECDAVGECVDIPPCLRRLPDGRFPLCSGGTVEYSVCGCDGSQVEIGGLFPGGYAPQAVQNRINDDGTCEPVSSAAHD
jgi:hypothetical protein